MPRPKVSPQIVADTFRKHGYFPEYNFQYNNMNQLHDVWDATNQKMIRLSFAKLKRWIRDKNIPEYNKTLNKFFNIYDPFNAEFGRLNTRELYKTAQKRKSNPTHDEFRNLMRINISKQSPQQKEQLDRFIQKNPTLRFMDRIYSQTVLDKYTELMKRLNKKQSFTFTIPPNRSNDQEYLHALYLAFKDQLPKLSAQNKLIRLSMTNNNDQTSYSLLNPNTLKYFNSLFDQTNYEEVSSSDRLIDNNIFSIKSIDINFQPSRDPTIPTNSQRRIRAGFFPFLLNDTNIDLSKFGIYHSIDELKSSQPCLIQSLTTSNKFTDDEIDFLSQSITTRLFPLTELKTLSDEFRTHFRVEWDNTHREYGEEYKSNRSIHLFIIADHYIYYEPDTQITSYYIENESEIIKNIKFINHPRIKLLSKYSERSYSFSKSGLSIKTLIKKLFELNKLIPLDEDSIIRLNYNQTMNSSPNQLLTSIRTRSVVIHPPKIRTHKDLTFKSSKFFGYKPDSSEIQYRIAELQELINKIPTRNHISVLEYFKFSELMQRLMFEFGCYDNVNETTDQSIRRSITFPKTGLIHPFIYPYQSEINQRYYHIDLNGAFTSCMTEISGNTKIKELIHILYQFRLKAKSQNNPKLATTIKFLMNSCYGYSIRRPKLFTNKFTSNIDSFIETYEPYIIKYNYSKENPLSGFVTTINPLVLHYTTPQFAKSILDNYNQLFSSIKSLINPIYENIDSLIVTETDFNTLNSLGYIHESQLGKFKIEHIFTSLHIFSPKKYIARLEDGTEYRHCM